MMTISIIVVVAVFAAFIAYIIGATCKHEHRHGLNDPFIFGYCCCDHYGIDSMRRRISVLEMNKQILESQMREIKLNIEATSKPIIYAKSISEQEIVDSLQKGLKPLNELMGKLSSFTNGR